VQRRAGKYGSMIAYAVDLDLEGGSQVRVAGFCYAPFWDPAEAQAFARTVGDWLNVPVEEQIASPAA
jgi:hypothetical protein